MKSLGSLALALIATGAFAQTTFTETEPNNTKATANAFTLAPGDSLAGNSSSADPDRYFLSFGAQATGVYLNTLTTSGSGFSGGLRGLALTNSGAIDASSDATVQFMVAPETGTTRINRFYTFGRATGIGYSLTSTAGTATPYTVAYTQSAVTPVTVASAFTAGTFTINAGANSTAQDSAIVLYDSAFNVVARNNDASATTFASRISASLAPGTYTLAITNTNAATNVGPDANEANNFGPDSSTNVLERDAILVATDSTQNVNLPLTIADSSGNSYAATFTKANKYQAGFYTFTVAAPVPEPATFAVLGLGALALVRRRRK